MEIRFFIAILLPPSISAYSSTSAFYYRNPDRPFKPARVAKHLIISSATNIPRIIGIGASAGGLDALERFFQAVPPATGMAFVIIQHLSNDHESHLAVLLERQTAMPVITVQDNIEIAANTIYVRQPNHELRVDGTYLTPVKRVTEGSDAYFPIDRFLLSLAKQRQEKAIAVILSGMGSDGSRGVDTIKENGGLVFVQSPESAQFAGMPNAAIRNGLADLITSPDEIANRLFTIMEKEVELQRDLELDTNMGQAALSSALIDLIHDKIGLDFNDYRPATILRRIEKRMLITLSESNRKYLQFVNKEPDEVMTLAKSFLIGVTRFFRDEEAFEIIRQRVIPQLFADANSHRPVRIWVPSCSTGEEAYTLAILAAEYCRTNNVDKEFKILASDIDPAAIKIANQGMYQESIRADVPKHLLDRHFTAELGGYRISRQLKDSILFAVQDLLQDPPFIRVDLISCRNFLIYINNEAQARILANFHFALNPAGFMILGPSENLGKLQSGFSVVDRRWKIYSRIKQDNLPLPNISAGGGRVQEWEEFANPNKGYYTKLSSTMLDTGPNAVVRDPYAQYLAERFAPTSLVVDDKYNIIYINGDVEGLLVFPRHHARLSLTKVMAPEVSAVLTSAVDAVLQSDQENRVEEVYLPKIEFRGGPYSVRVRALALPEVEPQLAIVMLEHADVVVNESSGEPEITDPDVLMQRRIHALEEKLLQSNLKTQKLLSEIEATNEELQTSNRELLASNEEMQSTNEELQSVNEELHTVNHEIQEKNEQLKLLNGDINHLLESTDIGTIFLDKNLLIRRFTPTIKKQFNLHVSDIGRPLTDFHSSFNDLQLAEKCRKVLKTFQRYEEEMVDRQDRDFLLRILPYNDYRENGSGVVITFINIKDLMEARRRFQDMATKYTALLNHTSDTIAVVNSTGRVEDINGWVEKLPAVEKIIGTYLVDLIEDDSQIVLFNNSLRAVIDSGAPKTINLTLRPQKENEANGVFLEITFIPAYLGEQNTGSSKDYVQLIIRDISEQVRDRHYTQQIIQHHRENLLKPGLQGGLISLDGQIVRWYDSSFPDAPPEQLELNHIADFVTATGLEKYKAAFKRLRNGSFEEIVHYKPEDVVVNSTNGAGVRVSYKPIITDGEIRLIAAFEISEEE